MSSLILTHPLQEIRKFAEEHELAASIIKTLLTILAELAISAMKGKVSPATLLLLMKAINFDKAKAEAFREGEISGRNGKIVEEHFPTTDDGIPHFTGMNTKEKKNNDIFSMAKEA